MKKIFFLSILILALLLSCQEKEDQSLTEDEATAILNKLMVTMSNADTTLAVEILHPDCELRYPLLPEPAKGIEACKKLIVSTANTFSNFKGLIKEVNIKGDRIWSRYSMSGINTGALGQIPATGKKFQITGMAITRIKDGKIIEDETYWNVWDFYNQLGFKLLPPEKKSES